MFVSSVRVCLSSWPSFRVPWASERLAEALRGPRFPAPTQTQAKQSSESTAPVLQSASSMSPSSGAVELGSRTVFYRNGDNVFLSVSWMFSVFKP